MQSLHVLKTKTKKVHIVIWSYYVDTAGKDTKKIQKYIQNQLKEDQIAKQLELELQDPFSKKG